MNSHYLTVLMPFQVLKIFLNTFFLKATNSFLLTLNPYLLTYPLLEQST